MKRCSLDIYVGNLSYSTTEEDLRQLFEAHGAVESAKVVKDRETNRSKGFGFVTMLDSAEADKAIQSLNESEFLGRAIKVNQAKPREAVRRSTSFSR